MTGVVLAAGRGSRMAHASDTPPKPLLKMLGLSLIERVILTAKQAGIGDLLIVTGYRGEQIQNALGNGAKYGVSLRYVENEQWESGNATSVLACKDLVTEPFALLMSDHVFDPRILHELLRSSPSTSVLLAVDRRPPTAEDTKVREVGGQIVEIGKTIESANGVDTGLFICTPGFFSHVQDAVAAECCELSDAVTHAAGEQDAAVFDITTCETYVSKMRKRSDLWWIDIDSPDDLKTARHMIVEAASKNPSDLLAKYIHKPVENRLVAWIARFPVTPNQLTVAVNVLAYAVTGLYLLGHLLPACLLSFVVGVADGLDGKLARVKLSSSKLGQLEHSFDLLFEFSWLLALATHLSLKNTSPAPLLLCAVTITLIAFYRHIYDLFRAASGRSLDDYGAFERAFRRVAGRRNLYNIPLLVSILLNHPVYGLSFVALHAAVTAAVYAGRAIVHLRVLDALGNEGSGRHGETPPTG